MNMQNEIIEALADYEHDRWARWQKYLFGICVINDDGNLVIPKEKTIEWMRQIKAEYAELTEEEKEKDRIEARKMLEIFIKYNK